MLGELPDKEFLATTEWAKKAKKAGLYTLEGGLGAMPKGLHESLEANPDVDLICGSAVQSLELSPGGKGVVLHTAEGSIDVDHAFSAIPGFALSELLRASGDPASLPVKGAHGQASIAELLDTGVPYAGIAVANFSFDHKVLPHEGFGHLVPFCEQRDADGAPCPVLGVVYDSSVFPQLGRGDSHTRLTVMMGGARHRNLMKEIGHDEAAWRKIAIAGLQRQLGIDGTKAIAAPVMVSEKAIPQYQVGHLDRKRLIQGSLDEAWDGRLTVVGSALHGVSVNDCVGHGRDTAAAYLQKTRGLYHNLTPREEEMLREMRILQQRTASSAPEQPRTVLWGNAESKLATALHLQKQAEALKVAAALDVQKESEALKQQHAADLREIEAKEAEAAAKVAQLQKEIAALQQQHESDSKLMDERKKKTLAMVGGR